MINRFEIATFSVIAVMLGLLMGSWILGVIGAMFYWLVPDDYDWG